MERNLLDLASLCKESSFESDLLSCPQRKLVYRQCVSSRKLCTFYRLDCDHQQIISLSMSTRKSGTKMTKDNQLLIMKCKNNGKDTHEFFGPWQLIEFLMYKLQITITNWPTFTACVLLFVLVVFAFVILIFKQCLMIYL